MRNRAALTLADARKIVAAIEAEAIQSGLAVSMTVCDDSGHALALLRMDGAAPMTAHLAQEKARTAALFRTATKGLEDKIVSGRNAILALPALPIEGGEMIIVDGDCIGAVGVSGAKPADDARMARVGVAAIGAVSAL